MKEVISREIGKDMWSTLLVKDDVIQYTESKHITGTNQHSGKSFSRFAPVSGRIHSWKQGRMRVYSKTAKTQHRPASFYDITADALTNEFWNKTSEDGFKILFGKSSDQVFKEQYPMLQYAQPRPGITPAMTAKDASEFTLRLFGKRNHRKDLVRSVGGVLEYAPNDLTTTALSAAVAMKGLVPVDWLVDWIPRIVRGDSANLVNGYPPIRRDGVRVSEFREVFKHLSEKQRRRLVTTDGSLYAIRDTMVILRQIFEKDDTYRVADLEIVSFKDLHDKLARDHRRMKEKRQVISYKKEAGRLAGDYLLADSESRYRIVAPEDTWELADWGSDMNNCIASYGRQAVNGTTLLYAVYKDGKMVGNAELDPSGNIKQLLGKHNGGVDADVQKVVYDAILEQWPNANVLGGWQNKLWHEAEYRREGVQPDREIFF